MAMFQVLICFICLDQLLALHLTVCLKKKKIYSRVKRWGKCCFCVFNCRCRFILSIACHLPSWWYCITIEDNKNLHRIHGELWFFPYPTLLGCVWVFCLICVSAKMRIKWDRVTPYHVLVSAMVHKLSRSCKGRICGGTYPSCFELLVDRKWPCCVFYNEKRSIGTLWALNKSSRCLFLAFSVMHFF